MGVRDDFHYILNGAAQDITQILNRVYCHAFILTQCIQSPSAYTVLIDKLVLSDSSLRQCAPQWSVANQQQSPLSDT